MLLTKRLMMARRVLDTPDCDTPDYDPYWDDVALLLKGDGPDGSTNIIDSSVNNHSVTVHGNAKISTAQSKFGGSSFVFDGSGGYLAVSDPEMNFGTGNYTIELFARGMGSQPRLYPVLFTSEIGAQFGTGSFFFRDNFAGDVVSVSHGTTRVITTSHALRFDNSWRHFALTRGGGTLRLYIDGVLAGSSTTTLAMNFSELTIGFARYSPSHTSFNGYIDELRITKGVARYTANFTPPTEPFPTRGP